MNGFYVMRWERGIGWIEHPPPFEYGRAYWEKYRTLSETPLGRRIVEGRLRLVERYADRDRGALLDFGIGSGAFLERAAAAGWTVRGLDANPAGVAWLRARGWDARLSPVAPVEATTYWDSLEHVADWRRSIQDDGGRFVFISTPLYTGPGEARRSKHYKPGEHIWYFSDAGLTAAMAELGYRRRLLSDWESSPTIGRESIGTFVFEKVLARAGSRCSTALG